MVEEMQAAMNLPTRGELNTTHSRVQALRRELRELRSQVEELGLSDMHTQLQALREEVQALTANRAPSPAGKQEKRPPAKRRKAAPRESPSRKPTTARNKKGE